MTPRIHYFFRDGARLCVRVWSQGGEPILLLHGGPGMPDYLMPVAGLLTRDLQVITYDQRGSGESYSTGGDYSFERHVEDLAAVAAALGLERFHLFGHSWGGLLAQLYAQEKPGSVKSLFLCNAMTGIGSGFLRMLAYLVSHYHRAAGIKGSMQMDFGFLLLSIPGKLRDFGARLLYRQVWRNFFAFSRFKPKINDRWVDGIHGYAVRRTLLSLARGSAKILQPVKLPRSVPVLALYGAQDVFGPEYRAVFNRYPWARKELMPHCGHIPWVHNPIAFAVLLQEFYAPYAVKRPARVSRRRLQ